MAAMGTQRAGEEDRKQKRENQGERQSGGEGRTPTGYAHCARSKCEAPNKISPHETKGGCVWLWDATSTHASMRTHTNHSRPFYLVNFWHSL